MAGVVLGLQVGRTGRADEEAIRDIFLATRGEGLTRPKNQINSRTDAHDLEGLVFVDIDDPRIRQQLLDDISAEAVHVQADEAKVLSDIDDTAVAAIHDDRYPKGTLYPGILARYEALDRGPTPDTTSMGDLTFLTARPADAFGLIENHTRETLRKAGVGTASVL